MKDKSALAQGWFRKADSDLADARRTAASDAQLDEHPARTHRALFAFDAEDFETGSYPLAARPSPMEAKAHVDS